MFVFVWFVEWFYIVMLENLRFVIYVKDYGLLLLKWVCLMWFMDFNFVFFWKKGYVVLYLLIVGLFVGFSWLDVVYELLF